jgi:putative glycosyltransferase (TIGR04372 family)
MALLGKRSDRTFLLKTDVGFANDGIVHYLSDYLHIVRKQRLRRFLRDCFVMADAVVPTQSYASAMYRTAGCFDIYRRWGRRAPLFRLTDEDRRFGADRLSQMGLPDGAWFVCVHAREGGYSPTDEALHSFRNMDVEDYALAIEDITARGGWCVRMGDASMRPLRARANVIDYARSTHKSARMDIFLAASCRFFLGCSSGLYNIAAIFGRPAAMTNTAPLSAAYVYGLDDLAIPQRVRLADGRMPPFEEILATDIANFRLTGEFERRGITLVRASPAEIRDLTVEMLDRLDGTAVYSREDEERQERFKALFREGHYSYKAGSRIGRDFLNHYFCPSPSPSVTLASAEPG